MGLDSNLEEGQTVFIVFEAVATIAGCCNDHDYNHWPGGPLPAVGQMDPLWKWRLLMNTDGGTQFVHSFKKKIVQTAIRPAKTPTFSTRKGGLHSAK